MLMTESAGGAGGGGGDDDGDGRRLTWCAKWSPSSAVDGLCRRRRLSRRVE